MAAAPIDVDQGAVDEGHGPPCCMDHAIGAPGGKALNNTRPAFRVPRSRSFEASSSSSWANTAKHSESSAARLAEVAGAKIDFVQLELDANDPSASWAIETLERLGFFFGAFLPDFSDRGDRIVLQRVTPGTVNVGGIACARTEGEELRDMTLREWKRVNDALLGLTPTN